MKKLLPFLYLLFMVSAAQAQYKPILFGLRVGGSMAWVNTNTDGYSSEGVVPAFTWGFIGEFFIMENYAILTGFDVNYNGGKLTYPYYKDVNGDQIPEEGQLHRKYNLRYIEVPLCLKMKTSISDKVNVFGKIGLGTSFRLRANGTDDFSYPEGQVSYSKQNIDNDVSLIRESLIIGGGIELKLKGSSALIFDLTYDNAFNNMLTGNDPSLTYSNPKAIQNFVELGAGIVF